MSRYFAWIFLAVVALTASPVSAVTYEVGGCRTGSGYVNFTTISAAVAGVPPSATILVCPGTYPEQVTITKPLTLKGIVSGNASRAVIVINPNGILAPNTTSKVLGASIYAQVLVENITPAGAVDLVGITVDGTFGNLPGCSDPNVGPDLVGIFYAQGTTGIINQVTARHQLNSGCGSGIWAENTAGASQSVTIANNSVRNFDSWGIAALSNNSPSTLSATISKNFTTANLGSGYAVLAEGMTGTITGNVMTGGYEGVLTEAFAGPITVSANTVADIPSGIGMEVDDTATGNVVSNVSTGFHFPAPPNTIQSNTTMNTTYAFDIGCTLASNTFSKNVINDSQFAYRFPPSGFVSGGVLYSVDTIFTGACP